VPPNMLVSCDAIPAVADISATDNDDPAPTVAYAEIYNDVVDGCGTIVRTWTASDACGNTASAEQTIDVEDTVPPELVGVPGDIAVTCDAIPAPADVAATDNCGTGLVVVFSEEDVVVAGQRAIVRTWSVTDNCDGGTTTANQTITVNAAAPPTIVCPDDLEVDSLPEPDPESVMATDACGGLVAVTYEGDEVVQQDPCSLVVRRTYRATDASGNSATCVQTITAGKPVSSTDAILWLPPLARKGLAEDTDPSAGGTLKYTFKAGCVIPVQVKVQSCGSAVEDSDRGHGHDSRHESGRRHHHDQPAVVAEVNLYADRNCDNLPDGGELPIKGNCKGGKGGTMEQVGDKFKFDLDTRSLTAPGCYVLEVVVTDVGTGQRQSERVFLKRK
jgi:large repetitive protein